MTDEPRKDEPCALFTAPTRSANIILLPYYSLREGKANPGHIMAAAITLTFITFMNKRKNL